MMMMIIIIIIIITGTLLEDLFDVCYSTYQHETITSRSRQLLMMGT